MESSDERSESPMTLMRVTTTITGAQGSPWLSTLHFDTSGGGTAQQAANAVATFWGAVDNFMDSSTSWVTNPTVVAFDEANGENSAFFTVTTAGAVGAVADISLPYATQALIRLFSDDVVNSHQVRGRIFVPGITRNNLGEGVANAALITGLNAAIAALIADTNCVLSIWSREVTAEHATENSPVRAGTKHVVTAGSTSTQFAVLTSRRD
jgi:hypothetical protein